MKILIWILSLAALAAALVIAAAGPGTRFGLWDYGTGLGLIRQAAMPAMIGAGAGLVAVVLAFIRAKGLLPLAIAGTLAAGAAAMVPIEMRRDFEANPFIHDITTDFDDPPQIVSAANEPRNNPPDYLGDDPAPRSEMTVAEAQRAAFPDIVPIETALSVEEAAKRAEAAVKAMNMKLLTSEPVDDGWIIEAAYTSFWFGFVDDFVVRVRPGDSGAVVDIRSKSRVGGSDLGANTKRVRDFMERFEAAG